MAEVATAQPLLQENSRETSTEKRKKREEKEGAHHRKTSPTPLPRELQRDARGLEKQLGEGWVKRRSGLLAFWEQVRVCSSQTRNLSLNFLELLVVTRGVQNLERPGKPNSSRHAMILATTEACIIASAGLATLSQATVPCLLSLVPETPV